MPASRPSLRRFTVPTVTKDLTTENTERTETTLTPPHFGAPSISSCPPSAARVRCRTQLIRWSIASEVGRVWNSAGVPAVSCRAQSAILKPHPRDARKMRKRTCGRQVVRRQTRTDFAGQLRTCTTQSSAPDIAGQFTRSWARSPLYSGHFGHLGHVGRLARPRQLAAPPRTPHDGASLPGRLGAPLRGRAVPRDAGEGIVTASRAYRASAYALRVDVTSNV